MSVLISQSVRLRCELVIIMMMMVKIDVVGSFIQGMLLP